MFLFQVNKRRPYHGINFVIAHDGFSLRDLVSYNFKVTPPKFVLQFRIVGQNLIFSLILDFVAQ
jgi:hypothetical protein